jgi:hypothetical protein
MQDQPISRTRLLQEGRIMKFESTYEDWVDGRLTQSVAAASMALTGLANSAITESPALIVFNG